VDTLYAVTGNAFAHLKLIDAAAGRWQVQLHLRGKNVTCLDSDPGAPDTVYVGTRGSGLWKSTDGGSHWENLNLPQSDVFSVAVSPADGSLYAGCEPSRLWRSRDGGKNWTALDRMLQLPSAPTWSFPPRPWTSHVRWIAPHPKEADRLLVGIELGGVLLTEDGGESWHDQRPGSQRDVHALTWHPLEANRAYEAGGGGAAWSHDGGMTWQTVKEGSDRHYTWGLAVDPRDPDTWFISASTGPGPAHGGLNAQACIFRWRGDGPWQAVSDNIRSDAAGPGPLTAMPYALAICEGQLLAGLSDGQIVVSQDEGDTWSSLILEGDPVGNIQSILCVTR
jgi:hypothetical protein